jgi:hypothetical protein
MSTWGEEAYGIECPPTTVLLVEGMSIMDRSRRSKATYVTRNNPYLGSDHPKEEGLRGIAEFEDERKHFKAADEEH